MSSPASLLSGSPASLWNPVSQGVLTVALGASVSNVVNDAQITANTVILFQPSGGVDATAQNFSPVLVDGVSFGLACQAATAATDVRYWILKY